MQQQTRSGKLHAACNFWNRGLFKKLHAATFFLYQHILAGLVVMLIVILGCILPCFAWETVQQAFGHQQVKLYVSCSRCRAIVRCALCKWKDKEKMSELNKFSTTVTSIVRAAPELSGQESRNLVSPTEGMESCWF